MNQNEEQQNTDTKLIKENIPKHDQTPNKAKGEKKATVKTKRISKPKSKQTPMEKYKLNIQQEMFCQYYSSPSEYFGNGVQSYIQAYDIDVTMKGAYASAKSSASQLLTSSNICKRIESLLTELGMNDMFVDKQLTFLISQHGDFGTKLGAIREYNKLKARITEKHEHKVDFAPVTKIIIEAETTNNESGTDTTASHGEEGADSAVQTDSETETSTETS